MISKDELSATLLSWLESNPEIELAILFGSFSKNQQHVDSDIDLAISCDTKISAQQKMLFVSQLQELCHKDIDLIDLKSVGQPLLSQIISDGVMLIGTTKAYAEIAIRNVNLNEDFLPYIERTQLERKKTFLNG